MLTLPVKITVDTRGLCLPFLPSVATSITCSSPGVMSRMVTFESDTLKQQWDLSLFLVTLYVQIPSAGSHFRDAEFSVFEIIWISPGGGMPGNRGFTNQLQNRKKIVRDHSTVKQCPPFLRN